MLPVTKLTFKGKDDKHKKRILIHKNNLKKYTFNVYVIKLYIYIKQEECASRQNILVIS